MYVTIILRLDGENAMGEVVPINQRQIEAGTPGEVIPERVERVWRETVMTDEEMQLFLEMFNLRLKENDGV